MRVSRLLKSVFATTAALLAVPANPARADNDPTVQKAIGFLRSKAGAQQIGQAALTALAMIKAEVPPNDPALVDCVKKLRSRLTAEGYQPELKGGHEVYEAACVALALANLDVEGRRTDIEAVARFLVGRQNPNGSWDYTGRQQGDTSISQYGVLGLWECENAGIDVPPDVWDRAASWFLSVQNPTTGSWNYHRDETSYPETLSMSAAGVGSLLICQRQLARYRKGAAEFSALLTPLLPEGHRARYEVQVPAARIDAAARRGVAWLGANFAVGESTLVGQSSYYCLYGIERIGALADRDTLGRVNWFEAGSRYIRASQRADGSWNSGHGEVPNTAWGVLFITKSTAKTIRKFDVKRLGAGTLLGGRGLPKDLGNLTVAGGRVVSRPMNGAVEGMLSVLEDPRAESADAALAGLVERYRKEGPAVLKPHKDRFRRLLSDRDPGLRRVAAWALARTTDLDVVPALVGALVDPEEGVVTAAKEGLQLLSRKIAALGPPSPSTPEQRREAAKLWRAWFAAIRPLDLEGQDEAPAPNEAPAAK